jgi:hypothetical protein
MTDNTFRNLVADAMATAKDRKSGLFDLSEANLDDFMAIYVGAEPETPSAEEHARWRERVAGWFASARPDIEDGIPVLTRFMILNFLASVHADDERFPRSAIPRRAEALAKALPHLAAQ